MMSWVSLFFEAVLAILMIALIIYCIKLNRRLSLLRDQNAEFADMMAGLGEASERAEQAVGHLKTAGLSAEKSLRSVIADATVAQENLSRLVAESSQLTAPPASSAQPTDSGPAPSAVSPPDGPGREKVRRDMLMDLQAAPPADPEAPPVRPKTREEAEETVLQAIRSARGGA